MKPLAGKHAEGRKSFASSVELCEYVRDVYGDTALLAFSRGKDAIAAYVQLKACGFKRIVPYFYIWIPGLKFVEDSLRYYEREMGTEIVRLPHPSMYDRLRNFCYQPPERWPALKRAFKNIPEVSKDDLVNHVRERLGLERAFAAVGVRETDSPMRLLSIRKNGPINYTSKTFYPVYDWRLAQVKDACANSGLKLPVDYRMFGRTFDGIDYRFTEPMKKHFPEDYRRLLFWFPLAELDALRREYAAIPREE